MRIHEIIFWDNDPTEEPRSIPNLDFPPGPLDNDLSNLARAAFTRRGLVKHLWYARGLEEQSSGPAPLNVDPDVIPSGTLEPTTASVPAKPVETGASGRSALVRPFLAVLRGVSRPTSPT
jgi:hypothetical protein